MKEQVVVAVIGIVAILAIFGSIFMWLSMSNYGLEHIDVTIQNKDTVAYQTGWYLVILIAGGLLATIVIGVKVVDSL